MGTVRACAPLRSSTAVWRCWRSRFRARGGDLQGARRVGDLRLLPAHLDDARPLLDASPLSRAHVSCRVSVERAAFTMSEAVAFVACVDVCCVPVYRHGFAACIGVHSKEIHGAYTKN